MSGLWRYNMSRYVEHSQAMFVRPAQHLGPTHSAANETRRSMHWHSPLGGEVLGQAAMKRPARQVAKWGDCRYCHLCHATNAVGSDILGVPSSTTTPNRIHLSAQPHHLILHYFTESSWKWPVSTNLASNSWHKNMRSCLSISSGLPNYQFHQTQEKFKKLGTYSFAQVPSCSLASACHQLPAMAFWGERLKTSALILVQWEHFAGPS